MRCTLQNMFTNLTVALDALRGAWLDILAVVMNNEAESEYSPHDTASALRVNLKWTNVPDVQELFSQLTTPRICNYQRGWELTNFRLAAESSWLERLAKRRPTLRERRCRNEVASFRVVVNLQCAASARYRKLETPIVRRLVAGQSGLRTSLMAACVARQLSVPVASSTKYTKDCCNNRFLFSKDKILAKSLHCALVSSCADRVAEAKRSLPFRNLNFACIAKCPIWYRFGKSCSPRGLSQELNYVKSLLPRHNKGRLNGGGATPRTSSTSALR